MIAAIKRWTIVRNDQSYWFLFLVLIVLTAYSTTLESMFSVWWEDGSAYSHGLLLALIAVIIFIREWFNDENDFTLGFHLTSFILLLMSILLWMASHLMFIQSAEQLFFLAIMFFLFPTVLGIKPSLKYFFPVILLLVAVPVWGAVISVLQLSTTIMSAFFLKLSGITSVRDGFFILVPAGTFEVEAACSGLRYQLAGLSISLLYVYMIQMKILSSMFFLCGSIIVVFFANVTRIYIVVLIGELTQMKSPLVEDHLWLGWLIFVVYIVLFLWAAEKFIPVQSINENTQKDRKSPHQGRKAGSKSQVISLLVVVGVCITGPILADYYSLEQYRDEKIALDLPAQSPDWREMNESTPSSSLGSSYQKANGELAKRYINSDNLVVSYQQYYFLFQEQGREAINELNQIYDRKYWKEIKRSNYEVPNGWQGQVFQVEEIIVRRPSGKIKLLWLWYRTNGQVVADKKQAKLQNLYAILAGNPAISVNVLSTDVTQDERQARHLLSRFMSSTIMTSLPISHDGAFISN